jgi:hypothetical protein
VKVIDYKHMVKKTKRRLYIWKEPGDSSRQQQAYILAKHLFRNRMKEIHTMHGADTDSSHNRLDAKMWARLKKKIKFQKWEPRWDPEKLHAKQQQVHDSLEENLGATECEIGNVEVRWNNIKKCVIDIMSDLIGKVKRKARKQCVSQEMINKMGQRKKLKNANNEGKKEERQNTDERIENSCRQCQEGVS